MLYINLVIGMNGLYILIWYDYIRFKKNKSDFVGHVLDGNG